MNSSEEELFGNSPFGVAAVVTIKKLFGQIETNLPGTIAGEDIEALHDMRVASRRLRTAFRIFKKCFHKNELDSIVEDIKNVTSSLGLVRDQDVFLEYLNEYAESDKNLDIKWLIDKENKKREMLRVEMMEALKHLDINTLRIKIEALLRHALMTEHNVKGNAFAHWAPRSIRPGLKEITSYTHRLEDCSDISGHHLMRISAKRLRYTMEAFVPCFDKGLASAIGSLKQLQDMLGQIHDCDVWVEKLRGYESEVDLSVHQVEALDKLIFDRERFRFTTYSDALKHWLAMVENKFAEQVIGIVCAKPTSSAYNIENLINVGKRLEDVESILCDLPDDDRVMKKEWDVLIGNVRSLRKKLNHLIEV